MAKITRSKGGGRGGSNTRSSPSVKVNKLPSAQQSNSALPSGRGPSPKESSYLRFMVLAGGFIFLIIVVIVLVKLFSAPPIFSIEQIPWSQLVVYPEILAAIIVIAIGVIFIIAVMMDRNVDGFVNIFNTLSQRMFGIKPHQHDSDPARTNSFYITIVISGLTFMALCLLISLMALSLRQPYRIQMPLISRDTDTGIAAPESPLSESPLHTPAP